MAAVGFTFPYHVLKTVITEIKAIIAYNAHRFQLAIKVHFWVRNETENGMDSRKQGKSLNMVHNDEIWKDHIRHELLAQKHWPEKWGFLSDIYHELSESLRETPGVEDEAGLKSKVDSVTNAETKGKFPTTHARMIGWKSGLSKRNAYGIPEGRARGRNDILRTFDWPQESQ